MVNKVLYTPEDYDDLTDLVEAEGDKYKVEYKEAKKKKPAKPVFPKVLKVHCHKKDDCDRFTKMIGMRLSPKTLEFVFTQNLARKNNASWADARTNKIRFKEKERLAKKNQQRRETDLWKNTVEHQNDGYTHWQTFHITIPTFDDYLDFQVRINKTLSLTASYLTVEKPISKIRFGWKSEWENHNPIHPIYIVTKGRSDSRLTAKALDAMGVPYRIVIEPQDYSAYSCFFTDEQILILPFSNHGKGPGVARNWCKYHAKSEGHKRFWTMDDNIKFFCRLYKQRKFKLLDGGMLRVIEEYVGRFKNVPLAGCQYRFFPAEKSPQVPFVLNTRIYSCQLMSTEDKYEYRGRYNEDTIISLDVLKDGNCTMDFNICLIEKEATQKLDGGNTAEFYAEEGTAPKSLMLKVAYPDDTKLSERFSRDHHIVNYKKYYHNEPLYCDDYDPEDNRKETDLFKFQKVPI